MEKKISKKHSPPIHSPKPDATQASFVYTARLVFILLSAVFGVLACRFNPGLEGDPLVWGGFGFMIAAVIVVVESFIRDFYPKNLAIAFGGLLLGLIIASLTSNLFPPASLIGEAPRATGVVGLYLFLGYLCTVFALRYAERIDLSSNRFLTADEPRLKGCKLLDTSVLIDGRILDAVKTGFLDGLFVIPRFVLDELQSVADSPDPSRRHRGRRGLDVVRALKDAPMNLEILEKEYLHIQAVDARLIQCAKDYQARIVTNDFNLNKVAEINNIQALNINDLTNALKPVILPGEILNVTILKPGKEPGQGVGYLDDGTMVVVEDGYGHLRQEIAVLVTSILQTTAGRMIFGRIPEEILAAERQINSTLHPPERKVVDLETSRESVRS
jgi:uncharacterized protein YacL